MCPDEHADANCDLLDLLAVPVTSTSFTGGPASSAASRPAQSAAVQACGFPAVSSWGPCGPASRVESSRGSARRPTQPGDIVMETTVASPVRLVPLRDVDDLHDADLDNVLADALADRY